MSFSRTATLDVQRSRAFGDISGSYALIGSTTFFEPVRILIVQNLTDVSLQFSDDGVNDKFPLAAGGTLVIDFAANTADGGPFLLPARKGIYVKEIGTPSSGAVYVSNVFGRND